MSKSNVKRKLTPDEVKRVEAEAESVAAMLKEMWQKPVRSMTPSKW